MNGITLALTRFWENKQISLPPMSTLLIAAGIMFFCFRLIVNGNRKEQEERAKARKNVFQNLDAAIAAAPICEHISCRTNPAKFYFLGVQTGIISEQEDAGILCSYLTHWMQTGAVTWQRLSGRSFSLHFEELQAGATPCEQALWDALCALVGEKRTATGKQLLQWSKCWEHSGFLRNGRTGSRSLYEWYLELNDLVSAELEQNGSIQIERVETSQRLFHKKQVKISLSSELQEEVVQIAGWKQFLKQKQPLQHGGIARTVLPSAGRPYIIFDTRLLLSDACELQACKGVGGTAFDRLRIERNRQHENHDGLCIGGTGTGICTVFRFFRGGSPTGNRRQNVSGL